MIPEKFPIPIDEDDMPFTGRFIAGIVGDPDRYARWYEPDPVCDPAPFWPDTTFGNRHARLLEPDNYETAAALLKDQAEKHFSYAKESGLHVIDTTYVVSATGTPTSEQPGLLSSVVKLPPSMQTLGPQMTEHVEPLLDGLGAYIRKAVSNDNLVLSDLCMAEQCSYDITGKQPTVIHDTDPYFVEIYDDDGKPTDSFCTLLRSYKRMGKIAGLPVALPKGVPDRDGIFSKA